MATIDTDNRVDRTDRPPHLGVSPSCASTSPTPLVVHLAGVGVLASVAVADPRGWYPFVVAKWAAVAVAVVVAWIAAGRTTRSQLPPLASRAFGALIAVLTIAALFGREPLYAWTGTPERQLGVLTWALFAAAMVVGATIDNAARRRVFARWTVAALTWSIAYAIAELIGRDPITTAVNTSRITGPYGSASMFGAALCLLIPVAFGLAVDRAERGSWRRAAMAAAVLGTSTVVATGTRAAWLGLLAAAGFAGAARLRNGRDRGAFGAVSFGAASGLAVGVVAVLTSPGVTERTAGGASRLAEWFVGVRIVAAHPWLGVGPEGYRTALADGVTAVYERTYGRATTPDRAHNALIDVGAAGGLMAAALYAILIGAAVYAAWRVVRAPDRSPVAVGMAMATVAYSAQSMFLFPVSTIDPVFWMIVGSTLVTAGPGRRLEAGAGRGATGRLVVGSLVAAALFVNGVVAVAADRAARVAVDSGNLFGAERAIELRPDVVRYRLLAASLEPTTIAGLHAAIFQTERALRVSPHDPIVEQAHADALLRLAIATREPNDVDAAVDEWRRLSTADANCYRCALALGYASALAGDTDSATAAFTRAGPLARPDDDEANEALESLRRSGARGDEGTNDGG